MKAAESMVHLRREKPGHMKNMVPKHVWKLAELHGLKSTAQEQKYEAVAQSNCHDRPNST